MIHVALVSLAYSVEPMCPWGHTKTGIAKWTYTVLVSFILIGVFHQMHVPDSYS